jgi:hypothetical protein
MLNTYLSSHFGKPSIPIRSDCEGTHPSCLEFLIPHSILLFSLDTQPNSTTCPIYSERGFNTPTLGSLKCGVVVVGNAEIEKVGAFRSRKIGYKSDLEKRVLHVR